MFLNKQKMFEKIDEFREKKYSIRNTYFKAAKREKK